MYVLRISMVYVIFINIENICITDMFVECSMYNTEIIILLCYSYIVKYSQLIMQIHNCSLKYILHIFIYSSNIISRFIPRSA